ncbi:MAG: NUDIX hydrolase, partial [Atopostipes sp.]|nr:NUDIX hydrolase [Atopostipes sp.]
RLTKRWNYKMKFEEKINHIKTIHDGKITKYQLAEVVLPNGEITEREIVRHQKAAAIIAFTPDNKLILVRQYRVAIGQTTLEIPAGLKDPADKNTLVTAKREFEEETGLKAKSWEKISSVYSTPGFTDEYLETYEATNLKKVTNPMNQDEDEFIEILALTYQEAMEAYSRGELCDSKTVFALFYWKLKKSEKN